jgi:hypothetical protein
MGLYGCLSPSQFSFPKFPFLGVFYPIPPISIASVTSSSQDLLGHFFFLLGSTGEFWLAISLGAFSSNARTILFS